jgi:hypothetical protein
MISIMFRQALPQSCVDPSCIKWHRIASDNTWNMHRMARPCHAAYCNRGSCHNHLGTFATATEDAERCIALEPRWTEGYAVKGSVELRTMHYHKARPWYPGIEISSLVPVVTCSYEMSSRYT